MVNYIFVDTKNKVKSIAEYNGAQYEFWQMLYNDYTTEEVEAFIKAEVLLIQGQEEEAIEVATPFMNGENTYTVTNEVIDGVLTTVESGQDNRSFLKRWYDNNF
jgi:hypothetical protein